MTFKVKKYFDFLNEHQTRLFEPINPLDIFDKEDLKSILLELEDNDISYTINTVVQNELGDNDEDDIETSTNFIPGKYKMGYEIGIRKPANITEHDKQVYQSVDRRLSELLDIDDLNYYTITDSWNIFYYVISKEEIIITKEYWLKLNNITGYNENLEAVVSMEELANKLYEGNSSTYKIWLENGHIEHDNYWNDVKPLEHFDALMNYHFDKENIKSLIKLTGLKVEYNIGQFKNRLSSEDIENIYNYLESDNDELLTDILQLYNDMYYDALAEEDLNDLENEFIRRINDNNDDKLFGIYVRREEQTISNSYGNPQKIHVYVVKFNWDIFQELLKEDKITDGSFNSNTLFQCVYDTLNELNELYKVSVTNFRGNDYASIDDKQFNNEVKSMINEEIKKRN